MKNKNSPSSIFEQYQTGIKFKSGLGTRGLYEQSKMNERYFVGDQWYGVNCGNDRPLIRHNVIKRIGEYKMAVVGAEPVAVNYSIDGIPNTLSLKERIKIIREGLAEGAENALARVNEMFEEKLLTDEEVTLVMSALSDYFNVTAERVKFEDIKEQALRNSYISGTGIVYTYWDERIRTGLYADQSRTQPIKGDIAVEVLDVENVYFGDPNCDNIQDQPYILVAQRKSIDELKREARRNRRSAYEIEQITDDTETGYEAGQMSEKEPPESRKTTVITKFWKEWNDDGTDYTIKAVKVCKNAVIRPEWDLGIRVYPFAKFTWERRRNCAYGESEITYIIPNQIAINRMSTASVWAVMMMGMPMVVVNRDVITQPITNDPGQIIEVNGGMEDVQTSIRYVNPPNFSPDFLLNIKSLSDNTMRLSGANNAALGEMRPENTSAIIALQEAAQMPLQQVRNRFYSFVEDIARIWAEFWIMKYGKRMLKVQDDSGTWYMPFNGDRYKDLIISTKIDVGASTLWSESQNIITLGNLYDRQIIDAVQYLSRLPKGIIPNLDKLIDEIKSRMQAEAQAQAQASTGEPTPQQQVEQFTADDIVGAQPPELQAVFHSLTPEQQQAILRNAVQAYQPSEVG